MNNNPLNALSPLDGRYEKDTQTLAPYFSELGLIKYRVIVEIEFLISLLTNGPQELRRKIDVGVLRNLYFSFTVGAGAEVKEYEKTTNHDVKAVEYWLRQQLDALGYGELKPFVHFGLTSEDVDSFARALSVRDGMIQVAREMDVIIELLRALKVNESGTIMLGRTHGQPALPTTFGKEMKVFYDRLIKAKAEIVRCKLPVKCNGAVGTRASLMFTFTDFTWRPFMVELVQRIEGYELQILEDYQPLKLERIGTTGQAEPHDYYASLFDKIKRWNTILIDFSQDMWRYISDGWVVQVPVKGEVGSSTMPQKINPINFENAEGNLGMANCLFEHFSRKLPISRLQRDLSDSTVMRNFGSAFGYSLIAYKNLIKGLRKIKTDPIKMKEVVYSHPEIFTEAIQMILRREGNDNAYEILKDFSRGEKVTLESLQKFIITLPISNDAKDQLLRLTPEGYLGIAKKKVKETVAI